ncbi:MAG TPA: FAD-dependent oxidoreductase [Burkholderiaceae bacterium]|nr:FAD-dependent oxidoreductase [Burkholderiaceae bacterium]
MKNIVVLGGGFAGLWAAVGAARARAEAGFTPADLAITLIDKNSFHNIRVRNYEADLRPVTVPLQKVLGPIQVESLCAAVEAVDTSEQTVQINGPSGPQLLPYDRLIIALGSQLNKPDIPGLKQHSFDVDTYYGALRLQAHLKTLASQPDTEARNTVLVVGRG